MVVSKNIKPHFFHKKQTGPRKNEQIKAAEVRVIGEAGQQIGLLPIMDALNTARNAGLDLVEISPNAKPPVCKITNFGKYLYSLTKKQKNNKTSSTKLKEIKLGALIEKNDFDFKLRQAELFLFKGNKIKIYIVLSWRQKNNQHIGVDVVQRMADSLKNVAIQDGSIVVSGRNIFTLMSPLPSNKRTLVHNAHEDFAE